MTEKFIYDVFISYSSQDKAIVHPLAKRLRNDGVKVWLDDWVLKPGDPISLKIQRGLEQSRVLLMCMSEAYFDSEWTTLEHHTLLFRDPTNKQRRFVPLLLEDCERPDTIAQFLHIDWRDRGDEDYKKIVKCCEFSKSSSYSIADMPLRNRSKTRTDDSITTIRGFKSTIFGLPVTSDGQRAISRSEGSPGLSVVDLQNERLFRPLTGHSPKSYGIAISQDGRHAVTGSIDGIVRIWDLQNECLVASLIGHSDEVSGVAISSNGRYAISGSDDKTVRVWDLADRSLVSTLTGHSDKITCVAISKDGRRALSGSLDNTVGYWNLKQHCLIARLPGHREATFGVCFMSDGDHAFSSSADKTIKFWHLGRLSPIATLEGHTDKVFSIALTRDDRRLVSASSDGSLRVWDAKRRVLLGTLRGHSQGINCVAVSSNGQLAFSGSQDNSLKVWNIGVFDNVDSSSDSAKYTNAKVVLVGESGVGKSGLALRLSEGDWHETGSTHGMSVTKLDLPNELAGPAVPAEREVWLWDFAGQPDYRLIHQLYMDETALALMVVDPQSDEPFVPLGHWEQALSRAVKRNPEKLLVAARCDRGGYVIGQRDIDDYLERRGYAGHINTSAKLDDDPGCAALKKLIAEHIPWDRLPSTSTTVLFKALKDAVIEIKESGIVLIRVVELEQRLRLCWEGEAFEERDLRTVIGLLAGQGLIQALDFGDFVLLQPEQINNYGSAVVRAARNSETELAELSEQDILEAKIDFLDMERLKPEDEKILLRAMLQTFFDRSLCLRVDTPEGVKLVFPAYFKQDRDEIPEEPQIKVTYGFTGPIDDIYTTLVVRLHYSHEFESDRLWKYAAEFEAFCGGRVGLLLTKERDEAARIQAYFLGEPTLNTEVLFIKYIHEHLKRHADDVTRARDYGCPSCETPLENKKAIAKRLERGFKDIVCGVCEERVLLQDLIEEKFASDELLQHVRKMDEQAQIGLDSESLELILIGHAFTTAGEAGHIFHHDAKPALGIDGVIVFKDDKGEESAKRLYLKLKAGGSYRRRRDREGGEMIEINDQDHAEQWQASEHPVMLVIRDADEKIRWMNVTEHLKRQGTVKKRIVFEGEPFTAVNVHKLWRALTGEKVLDPA